MEVGSGGEGSPELTGMPAIGDVIDGKFAIEGVLGVGGMGAVYAARHVQLGQRVAIKVLLRDAAKRSEAVARFLREARSAVGLQSAHVVRVMDVGTLPDGLPYMVMEHLTGTDLERADRGAADAPGGGGRRLRAPGHGGGRRGARGSASCTATSSPRTSFSPAAPTARRS